MSPPNDLVIRVMTDDHAFRVIACDVTQTVQQIALAQRVSGVAAQALGELVTATVLMRETMSPTLRVQGIAKGRGGGSLIGDSHPDGITRGLVQLKRDESGKVIQDFELGPGSVLQMMRSLPNGSLHQGIVAVEDRKGGGLSAALMTYLQESEQVISVAALGTTLAGEEIARAGGYIVQLLPEAERGAHMIMTQRLDDFTPIEDLLGHEAFNVPQLLDELLFGMPYTELARDEVMFGCRCSETSLLSALATLGREEVRSMVEQGEGLEITCDYCGRDYLIAIERLRALLADS